MTLALAAIAYSYSRFSGLKASIITDVVQLGIILMGGALLVVLSLRMTGGFDTVRAGLGAVSGEYTSLTSSTGIEVLLGYGLPMAVGLISGPFGDQCFWQRAFAIRRDRIGRSFFAGALLFALVPICMGTVGFLAAGSGFVASDTGMVNFEFVSSLLPTWVLVPFLFMIISGLLSTVDSNLCAAASLTTDWLGIGKDTVQTSRRIMLCLLIVAIAIANIPRPDGDIPIPVLRNAPRFDAAADGHDAARQEADGQGRFCWCADRAVCRASDLRLRQSRRHSGCESGRQSDDRPVQRPCRRYRLKKGGEGMSLGRKQSIDNSAWLEAVATIEDAVSREELDALTAAAVADIKAHTEGKAAAYAWSAGKDSIVLGKLCEAAGVTDCMIGVCDLEYPAFAAWIEEHKPAGCEVINTHQDIDWLAKHQEMLFPKDSAAAGRWFSIVQHRAQREYFKAHELDVIILGRRRADGNYVGRNSNIYTDGKGVTRFSPLAAWKHEHILAYIHYHQLPLPPIYGWKNGYLCGTHPWPARQWTGSIENGWREVYDIDPSIVLAAAEKIDSARAFLKGVQA